MAGSSFGLKLSLYSNFNQDLIETNSFQGFEEIRGGQGMLIRIENMSWSFDFEQDGIFLASGLHTDIVMSREFKKSLPRPYSNCELEENSTLDHTSHLNALITNSEYLYTQQFCFIQCIQMYFIEMFDCTCIFFNSIFSKQIQTCSADKCREILDNSTLIDDLIKNNCTLLFPLECYQYSFKTNIYSHNRLGEYYASLNFEFVCRFCL